MPWGAEVVRGCDSKPPKLPGLGHVKRPMYRCIDRASRLRETLASEWLSNSLLTATRSRAVGHQEDTQSFGSSKLTYMYIYVYYIYVVLKVAYDHDSCLSSPMPCWLIFSSRVSLCQCFLAAVELA